VQTCFLGRYVAQTGSDEFGAHIMMSGAGTANGAVQSIFAKFTNVEFYHVGQSYRLGRYPIHFHMNGDMSGSYM
jgi:hypothetical protein